MCIRYTNFVCYRAFDWNLVPSLLSNLFKTDPVDGFLERTWTYHEAGSQTV